jgi:type VI protein secretion system component VasF
MLRAHRATAPSEFRDSLEQRIEARTHRSPLYTWSRVSFASAVTVFMLGLLASFGGLGYAASGAGQAADSLQATVGTVRYVGETAAQVVTGGGPEEEQKIQVQREQRIAPSVSQAVPPLEAERESESLPFTGLALGTTLLVALGLIGTGIALRRAALRRERVKR